MARGSGRTASMYTYETEVMYTYETEIKSNLNTPSTARDSAPNSAESRLMTSARAMEVRFFVHHVCMHIHACTHKHKITQTHTHMLARTHTLHCLGVTRGSCIKKHSSFGTLLLDVPRRKRRRGFFTTSTPGHESPDLREDDHLIVPWSTRWWWRCRRQQVEVLKSQLPVNRTR